jgi:hypothetical protein
MTDYVDAHRVVTGGGAGLGCTTNPAIGYDVRIMSDCQWTLSAGAAVRNRALNCRPSAIRRELDGSRMRPNSKGHKWPAQHGSRMILHPCFAASHSLQYRDTFRRADDIVMLRGGTDSEAG